MNREEITEMLESIGVTRFAVRPHNWEGNLAVFEKFAALVAAKEREACAKLIEEVSLEELPDEPTDEGILQICTGVVWAERILARGQQ